MWLIGVTLPGLLFVLGIELLKVAQHSFRAFADAIQRALKDCKNKHVVNIAIILFIQKPHYMRYFSLLLNSVY